MKAKKGIDERTWNDLPTVPPILSVDDIEVFIEAQGSDDLGVFGGKVAGGINCQQVPDELAPCLHAILASGVEIHAYLEIGVASGGTTFLVDHFLHPELIVLVDDNQHQKAPLRSEVLKGIRYKEIIGKSLDEVVFDWVKGLGFWFDLILIDGDHNYPGVKLDTVTYLPLLRPGGFVAFHDSAMPQWGVQRVVRELKEDSSMEFVGEYTSKKHATPLGLALFRKAK